MAFCGPFQVSFTTTTIPSSSHISDSNQENQESQTAILKADQFDPDYLEVMINYFYDGTRPHTYECSPFIPSAKRLPAEDLQQEGIEHDVTFHIRINALADYFQASELLEESRSRFIAIVPPASPKVALVLLAEAYHVTGDRRLQELSSGKTK